MYNGSYQQYGQVAPSPVTNYGAPMHPPPTYPPAPAPAPYYQAPPPNPDFQIATNPNAFAHMFKAHLASLTFNSKPIITNLTVISHEHVQRMSHVVAQCLEEHVLSCPAAHRLPALYVIDSISKNIGQPYLALWSERILRIFMETYRVVDHSVKMRMEELLNTWRDSGPNARPLFGENAQWNIERALYGSSGPPPPASISSNRSPQPPVNLNASGHLQGSQARARTVERFDRLLAIGAHDQQHNVHLYDADRMQALAKLKTLVTEMPLSAEEMGQIEAQLVTLEAEVEARRQNVPPPVQGQTTRHDATHSGPSNPVPSALPASLSGALANLSKLGVGSATPPVQHATPVSAPSAPAPSTSSAQDLIASLRLAGLLPSSQAAAVAQPAPVTVIDQDVEYSNMIMSLNLRLTNVDMQRELPLGSLEAINFKEMPLQCRQCSNRYPNGPKGQASMDQHLDWHFRQNRRAKDSAVRGQSRSWFSRLDDWIRGGHDEDGPSKRTDEAAGPSSNRALTTMTPAQEAELKAATSAFVIAPTDDPSLATKPCPICKELFQSEWSEDEEEWIWKNAVQVNGVYYHGSCHYSAKTLTTTVKSSNGSREGTPLQSNGEGQTQSSRVSQIKEEEGVKSTPTQLAGLKRKSIKEEEGEEEEENQSAAKVARPSPTV